MSTYNNRRHYNGNKRRRSGGNSKGSNFWQIVLTLVTIMLFFSVFPVLAAITGHTHDVVNDPTEVEIITFTVDGEEFEAENGMTFEDWINSDYCDPSLNFHIEEEFVVCGTLKFNGPDNEHVKSSDVIVHMWGYDFD